LEIIPEEKLKSNFQSKYIGRNVKSNILQRDELKDENFGSVDYLPFEELKK